MPSDEIPARSRMGFEQARHPAVSHEIDLEEARWRIIPVPEGSYGNAILQQCADSRSRT